MSVFALRASSESWEMLICQYLFIDPTIKDDKFINNLEEIFLYNVCIIYDWKPKTPLSFSRSKPLAISYTLALLVLCYGLVVWYQESSTMFYVGGAAVLPPLYFGEGCGKGVKSGKFHNKVVKLV